MFGFHAETQLAPTLHQGDAVILDNLPSHKNSRAAETLRASRLQTDYIDLYQSHWFDPTVEQEETLEAYDRLIKAGKVRWIGASNYDGPLLSEALQISAAKGLPRYETLQNEYNLYTREKYEGEVQDLVTGKGLSLIPYFSLAAGFLTGKYRSKADLDQRPRGALIEKYLNDRGLGILAVLDEVAADKGATLAEVALAWVSAQPGVVGPLVSASSVEQLHGLLRGARLTLGAEDLTRLAEAGA